MPCSQYSLLLYCKQHSFLLKVLMLRFTWLRRLHGSNKHLVHAATWLYQRYTCMIRYGNRQVAHATCLLQIYTWWLQHNEDSIWYPNLSDKTFRWHECNADGHHGHLQPTHILWNNHKRNAHSTRNVQHPHIHLPIHGIMNTLYILPCHRVCISLELIMLTTLPCFSADLLLPAGVLPGRPPLSWGVPACMGRLCHTYIHILVEHKPSCRDGNVHPAFLALVVA